MSKYRSDVLFFLVKSLSRSEKRYFRLAETGAESRLYLRLFDLIDTQNEFNEFALFKAEPEFAQNQFSNLKAHLYSKILKSLRDFSRKRVPGIEIRELIDEAQILLNKSLYQQCGKRLDKAWKRAAETDNLELQLEILKWKKQVLTYTVDRENDTYVDEIVEKVREVNGRINNSNSFSNLQAKLQSLYRKSGYIRNEQDFQRIQNIFRESMPEIDEDGLSIGEKIHLYHLYIGYHFFIQDFEKGYDYARKWVNIFRENKALAGPKIEDYITGLNLLLIAQNKLGLYRPFLETKKELRQLNEMPSNFFNEHIRLKMLKYTYVHEFNSLFMTGDFDRGVVLFERLSSKIEGFIDQMDAHSRIILYYKTACLYFGNGDFRACLSWLNRIFVSGESDLREDIHGFARILALITHYELGNTDLIPYALRSTYRFLLKRDDLQLFQKLQLGFLRSLQPDMTDAQLTVRLAALRSQMLELLKNPFEKRAFVYFDFVSWLDSRIEQKPMMEIVKRKAYALLQIA